MEPSPPLAAGPTPLFSGARKSWRFVLKFILFSLAFLAAELAYQLLVLVPGDPGLALVRGFGLAGATFFGFALFSSALFRWHPAWAKYWYVRRSFGVMGTVFIILHVYAAITYNYAGDLAGPFLAGWNPLQNPVIFGILALPVFFLLFLTSTDWAVDTLGYRRWKAIHRLVYFGYLAAILHFLTINPASLLNPAGYLLVAATGLALFGQLFWFLKTAKRNGLRARGTVIGILIALLYALAFLAALFR